MSLPGVGESSCVGVISDTIVPARDAFGVIGDSRGIVVVDSDTTNGGSSGVIGDSWGSDGGGCSVRSI